MRFAKLCSFVIGLLGSAVIAVTVFVIIPGMGGGGPIWLLVALLLLAYAAFHVIPAAGLVMPWLLDRFPPKSRWLAFFVWAGTALPILLGDVMLVLGRGHAS